jgi:hypothetical protein
MIMLGTTFAQPSGCWTKPTSIQDINPEDIHGSDNTPHLRDAQPLFFFILIIILIKLKYIFNLLFIKTLFNN